MNYFSSAVVNHGRGDPSRLPNSKYENQIFLPHKYDKKYRSKDKFFSLPNQTDFRLSIFDFRFSLPHKYDKKYRRKDKFFSLPNQTDFRFSFSHGSRTKKPLRLFSHDSRLSIPHRFPVKNTLLFDDEFHFLAIIFLMPMND
jgi:hypothetical protein